MLSAWCIQPRWPPLRYRPLGSRFCARSSHPKAAWPNRLRQPKGTLPSQSGRPQLHQAGRPAHRLERTGEWLNFRDDSGPRRYLRSCDCIRPRNERNVTKKLMDDVAAIQRQGVLAYSNEIRQKYRTTAFSKTSRTVSFQISIRNILQRQFFAGKRFRRKRALQRL